MDPKYKLGPIPNFKESKDAPRFYVAHKSPGTGYVAIVPKDSFSFTGTLQDASSSAWWIAQDDCPWSVDCIVEILNRPAGSSIAQAAWRLHPAGAPIEYEAVPTIAPTYPDFGSW